MKFKRLTPEQYNKFLTLAATFIVLVVIYAPDEDDKVLMGIQFDTMLRQIGGEKLVEDLHRRIDTVMLAGSLRQEMEDLKNDKSE